MSLTTVDSGLISSGAITLTTQVTGTLPVANGGTGVTTSTGSGANVLGTSPTLVTPLLGTPTSGNLANCTGIPAPAALSTASGSAPSYSARAWVNFVGSSGSVNASGNVSSVTRDATGLYRINFTTSMADANYAVSTSMTGNSDTANTFSTNNYNNTYSNTTTYAAITTKFNGSPYDAGVTTVSIFR